MGRDQTGWGWGAFTYRACLLVLQAKGKKQQKMEAKQIIRAVVRKAETKKMATIWNAGSTGVFFGPKFQGARTEFFTRHTFFRGAGGAG